MAEATGLDVEFAEKPDSLLQTDCVICHLVLRNPCETTCCGVYFCKACLEKYQGYKKSCPNCRGKLGWHVSQAQARHINQLKVFCEHKAGGCEWVGELGQLKKHLNKNPTRTGCKFVQLKCPRCSQCMKRTEFNVHQTEECPYRDVKCSNHEKGCIWMGQHESMAKHLNVNCESGCYKGCDYVMLKCSFKCGQSIERYRLQEHKISCPYRLVDCEFKDLGCLFQVAHKDLQAHLSVHHMKTVIISLEEVKEGHAKQIRTLMQQNMETKERINTLEQQHLETEESICSLEEIEGTHVKSIRKLKQQNVETKDKIYTLQQQNLETEERLSLLEQLNVEITDSHTRWVSKLKQQNTETTEKIRTLQLQNIRIRTLEQQNLETNEMIYTLEQQNTEAKARIHTLERQNANYKSDIQALHSSVQSLTKDQSVHTIAIIVSAVFITVLLGISLWPLSQADTHAVKPLTLPAIMTMRNVSSYTKLKSWISPPLTWPDRDFIFLLEAYTSDKSDYGKGPLFGEYCVRFRTSSEQRHYLLKADITIQVVSNQSINQHTIHTKFNKWAPTQELFTDYSCFKLPENQISHQLHIRVLQVEIDKIKYPPDMFAICNRHQVGYTKMSQSFTSSHGTFTIELTPKSSTQMTLTVERQQYRDSHGILTLSYYGMSSAASHHTVIFTGNKASLFLLSSEFSLYDHELCFSFELTLERTQAWGTVAFAFVLIFGIIVCALLKYKNTTLNRIQVAFYVKMNSV